MIRKIILWILTILCAALIFKLSAQEATVSSKTSSVVIKTVVKAIDIKDSLTEKEVEEITKKLTFSVRKSAHFLIYATLGFLIALLYREYGFFGKKLFLKALITAFLYAASDELHQNFVKGRSAEIRDVAIDSLGAMCGIIFALSCIYYFYKIHKSNISRKEK